MRTEDNIESEEVWMREREEGDGSERAAHHSHFEAGPFALSSLLL